MAIPGNLYSDTVAVVEKLMPVHWAFRIFDEGAATEPSWPMIALSFVVVMTMATVFGDGGAHPQAGDRDMKKALQFKDFQAAASYHAPELIDTVDIPFLIQRLFQVPTEPIDTTEYEVALRRRPVAHAPRGQPASAGVRAGSGVLKGNG